MKTSEVALNFKNLNAQDLSIKGNAVFTKLTTGGVFTSCVAYLPILNTELAQLKTDIDAAKDEGTKAETSAMLSSAKKVKRTLKVIAAAISYEANGDETKLLTSGFDLKTYTPPSSKSFTAKLGKLSGEIILEINSYGSVAYYWEMSTDPITTWNKVALSNISKVTVKGLTPGTKLWFRVHITKGDKELLVSDPFTIMVV